MDIKIAFLNNVIEEEVYIEQPLGFETYDNGIHVCKLKKALYGLKKAHIACYGRIDGFLINLDFTKSKADSNLYYKVVNDGIMILLLYVDDIFFIGEEKLINELRRNLRKNSR